MSETCWTEDDLKAIDDAIRSAASSGVLEVEFPSGKRMRFHSLQAMMNLRDAIVRWINQCTAKHAGVSAAFSLANFH